MVVEVSPHGSSCAVAFRRMTTRWDQKLPRSNLFDCSNKITTFEDVQPLGALGEHGLDTLYLEYNPVADEFEYRKKLAELIPCLKQIDATMILGLAAHGLAPPTQSGGAAPQSAEEQMRRLQEAAIARARQQTDQKKQKDNQK